MAAINSKVVMEIASHGHEKLNENVVTVTSMNNSLSCQGVSEDIFHEAMNNDSSESFSETAEMQYADIKEGNLQGDAICNDMNHSNSTFVTTNRDGLNDTIHLSSNFTNFHMVNTDSGKSVLIPINSNGNSNLSHRTSQDGIVFSSAAEQSLLAQNNSDSFTSTAPDGSGLRQVHHLTQHIPIQNVQPTAIINAPLGSSQNPIRIVQQGNQYTPMQQLSPEQLQQVMQIVHQQQLARNATAGSNVIFNPQTNTKFVYRVVYPSDLLKDGEGTKAQGQQTTQFTTQKKVYKKRNKEEEQEKIEGPELSKEEKELRKKMRPKTRSGRVSKPPKHMVKDFKHIHVLDYDEDYDDSDGGYSDFKYSEEEEENENRKDDEETFNFGVDSTKPRNWKCITCEKAYIGRAGLGRHLRLNPSHGSLDDRDGDMEPPPPDSTPAASDEMATNMPTTPNSMNSTANSNASFSEDSRDSSTSLIYTPSTRPRGTRQRGRPRGSRGSWRGRGAFRMDPETRRRNKLKEIVMECTDEELMEIVLPRLAQVITLWEFLLMKVEKGDPAWPHADDIYKEYEKLHQHVKTLCQEYLQHMPNCDQLGQQALLEIKNKSVADALGLDVGFHKVKDIADTDSTVQYKYKLSTSNHVVDTEYNNKPFLKRPVEVISPEVIYSPKKIKLSIAKPVIILQSKNSMDDSSRKVNGVSQMSTKASVTSHSSLMPVNIQADSSKIEVLSNKNVNIDISADSGKSSAGRVVSIPPDSLTKHALSSPSLQQSTTLQQCPGKPTLTQKVIFVPERTTAIQQTDIKTHNNSLKLITGKNNVQTLAVAENNVNNPHLLTINEDRHAGLQNKVILHDEITGICTVCSVADDFSSVAEDRISNVPSAQSFVLSLPQVSNSQSLQPKKCLNEQNLLNCTSTDSIQFSRKASCSAERLNVNSILCGDDDGTLMEDSQSYMFTLPNGEGFTLPKPANIETSGSQDNIVYTLRNGELSQQNLVFAVDPDISIVNEVKNGPDNMLNNDLESDNVGYVNSTTNVLVTNVGDEVVGLLNSIDTSEPSRTHDKSSSNLNHSEDEQNSENNDLIQCIEQGQQNDNTDQFVAELFMNAATDQSQKLADMKTSTVEISGIVNGLPEQFQEYETDMDDTQQVETLQIPAANIFQTEDGLIFIQNPDGTAFQLQGSDGQAVSMETVQSFFGMGGGTQIVTDQ